MPLISSDTKDFTPPSAYPPIELPPGAKLEPVARVVEVVEERQALALWGQYERAAVATAFGGKYDASWTTGIRDVELGGSRHTVLFVTLRKEEQADVEQRYDDFFPSPREFRWSSQAKTGPEDGKGRKIIHHVEQGRRIHLFARTHKRDVPFVYCGKVRYVRHDGAQPMVVDFELETPLPESLWKLWST